KQRRGLERAAENRHLLLSAVSAYEAALIGIETDDRRRRGKQAVKMHPTVNQWIRDAIRGTRVLIVPLDAEAAVDGATFHSMHADPFDRLIVATAIQAKARLVTADALILKFARRAGVDVLEV